MSPSNAVGTTTLIPKIRTWGVPVYPIVGNHDLLHREPYPLEEFQNRFGDPIYSFEDGPVRFHFLETGMKRIDDQQFEVIEEQFASAGDDLLDFAVFHVPPDELEKEKDLPNEQRDKERLLAVAMANGIDGF
ncbi:MAG: metallophosphoesterase [Candidatus Competibacteraceae bacterium]|nr:metallophosphoesterase [Candidatus Competibacteraceae bacterium]